MFFDVAKFQEVLPDLGIDVPFCDLDPNGCHTTEPGCDEVIPGSGVQEFCTCSTLEVPDYAPVSYKNNVIIFASLMIYTVS